MTKSAADPVRIRRLSFARRSGFELNIPEFDLKPGESVVLTGASGSGKSTVLDLIAGVLRPRSGELALFGEDATALSSSALDALRGAHIGLIFQEQNLLPFASVAQNLAVALSFSSERRGRVAASGVAAESERLLDAMGLDPRDIMSRSVGELSVGQRQRVAAARAFLGAPSLILADEPTSALDPEAQGKFMEALAATRKSSGAALLMITHDPALTGGFDRAVSMDALVGESAKQGASA